MKNDPITAAEGTAATGSSRIGTMSNSGCFGLCGDPGVHLHFSVHQGTVGLRGNSALWLSRTAVNIWEAIPGLPNPQRKGQILVKLAPTIGQPVRQRGETFYNAQFDFTYQSGRMILSGDPPPLSVFGVDDAMEIRVTRPDGTMQTRTFIFQVGCAFVASRSPTDIADMFVAGVNVISVRLYDICGVSEGNGPIYLTNRLP